MAITNDDITRYVDLCLEVYGESIERKQAEKQLNELVDLMELVVLDQSISKNLNEDVNYGKTFKI